MSSLNWVHLSSGRCLLLKIFLTALLSYKLSDAHTYSWPLPNGFNDGDMVTVKGSLPIGGSRFSINFIGGSDITTSDIIFHMVSRYANDQIAINTKDNGTNWLNEEIYNETGALVGGRHFTAIIVLKGNQFMSHVYTWPLSNAFNDGDLVAIQGKLPSNGRRFDINFHQDKDVDVGDVYFHMSNRYGYDQIVLNSKEVRTGWLAEEVYNGTGAFAPGNFYTITIALSRNQFSVAINGCHFANFKVRKATSLIRYLSVVSEIELSSIALSQAAHK